VKNFAVSRPKVAVVLGKYSCELLPPPGNTGSYSIKAALPDLKENMLATAPVGQVYYGCSVLIRLQIHCVEMEKDPMHNVGI
jgi:hypothetical protein